MTWMSADEWVRPMPTRADLRRDIVLAVVVLVAAAVSTLLYALAGFYARPAPVWMDVLYVLAIAAPLAARRRHPEIAAVIVAIAFAAAQLLAVPEVLISNIALFLAIYSVGAWGRNRPAARAVRWAIIAGMFVWLTIALLLRANGVVAFASTGPTTSPAAEIAVSAIVVLVNLLYFGAAYVFGSRAWSDARSRAELDERTVELAAEREANSRRAVTRERLRIARDLHDVVAHHVSVMGVQAGAARRVLSTDSARAKESLLLVEDSARRAVAELHGLLGTLRDDGDPDEEATTDSPASHGLDDLDDLVRDAAGAGLRATLTPVGTTFTVPPTVGTVAYRVVQEALTNTLKHAGQNAVVDVRLRYLASAIELEIADSGGRPRRPATGTGLGQRGMRERVDAVGGRVHLAPTSRGGYLVRATIPVARVDAVDRVDATAPGGTP